MPVCRYCHVNIPVNPDGLLITHIEPVDEDRCEGSFRSAKDLPNPTQILFIRRDYSMFIADLDWLCGELSQCLPTMSEPGYMAAYVANELWNTTPITLNFLANEGMPYDRVVVSAYANGKFLERGWYLRDHKLGDSE